MSRARGAARRLLPVAVSALALYWVLRQVDPEKLAAALSWDIAAVLVPAFVVYGIVTLVLEAVSIARLLHPAPPDFTLLTAARIKSATYLLGIVNYTLGAAALTVLLRRRAGIGLGRAASVVLLISSVDLLVLLALAALAATVAVTSAAQQEDTRVLIGSLLALGTAGFFGGLVLLRAPVSLGPLERVRSLAVFEALRTTPLLRLAELALWRLAFSSCFIGLGALAFYAFGIAPPASVLVVGMVFIGVVAALPIAIAGLGTVQIAIVSFFGAHADRETLLALSLVLTAGMIALRVAIGLAFAREFTQEALRETRPEAE